MTRPSVLTTIVACATLFTLAPSRAAAQVAFALPGVADTIRCQVLIDHARGKGYRFEFGTEPSADDILRGQYGEFRRIDILYDSAGRYVFLADLVMGGKPFAPSLAATVHRAADGSPIGTRLVMRPRGVVPDSLPASAADLIEKEQAELAAEELARADTLTDFLFRRACRGPVARRRP